MESQNPRIETMAELEQAKALGKSSVYCICPNCKDGWTSLLINAKSILENGCLCCVEDGWKPVVGISIKNT